MRRSQGQGIIVERTSSKRGVIERILGANSVARWTYRSAGGRERSMRYVGMGSRLRGGGLGAMVGETVCDGELLGSGRRYIW